MKKLLLILFLIPIILKAQNRPLPVNAYGEYEFVRKVPVKVDKDEIFKRLKEWLSIRKFGEPISIKALDDNVFSTSLAANNYDYVDTAEGRIRGSGYIQYSAGKPWMYVTFDYQLIAEDGAFTYDFKRFNVIKFVSGKSMRAHSFRVSLYTGAAGSVSDADSQTKSLEGVVEEANNIRRKKVRQTALMDIELFKDNMQEMILQLNKTVKGEF